MTDDNHSPNYQSLYDEHFTDLFDYGCMKCGFRKRKGNMKTWKNIDFIICLDCLNYISCSKCEIPIHDCTLSSLLLEEHKVIKQKNYDLRNNAGYYRIEKVDIQEPFVNQDKIEWYLI